MTKSALCIGINNYFDTRGLLDDDIHSLFDNRTPSVRLLLISDSCHSGSVTRGDERDLDADAFSLPSCLDESRQPASRARGKPLAGGLPLAAAICCWPVAATMNTAGILAAHARCASSSEDRLS